MSSKHPKPEEQPAGGSDDLDQNPGIGQSKGLFAREGVRDGESIEGGSTVEDDRENDAALGQGADTDLGRTND